jgi:hypothetical protein
MATWDDVRRLALALPETSEAETDMAWKVKDKGFAWERPLRKKDLADLGAAAPDGPILCVRTPGVGAKETLLADSPQIYFTTPHFNGYPAVLVRLGEIGADELTEILEEAWLAVAPKRLAKEYLADR